MVRSLPGFSPTCLTITSVSLLMVLDLKNKHKIVICCKARTRPRIISDDTPVADIFHRHGVEYQIYANNTQVYLAFTLALRLKL